MVRPTLSIHPERHETSDAVRYDFDLRYSDNARRNVVFYEFDRNFAPAPVNNFDGILCATILHAMAEGRDIRLHGPATSALLLNLEEFQAAWSRWLPANYRPVGIEVDSAIDSPVLLKRRSISAFSGGVDSAFTLLRNSVRSNTPRHAADTVLMVHGFDVLLSNPSDLHELIDRTVLIREASGVHLRVVRTNSRQLQPQSWEHSFAPQLAACLHLFSTEFSTALIGSSEPYDAMVLPWGSNPVTDHLLTGGSLKIVHDGAGFSRTEKAAFLSHHPAALRSLKVCWEGKRQDRNCGVCEKCVRTRLNLLAVGLDDPPCFDGPLDLSLLNHISIKNDAQLAELRSILEYAETHNINAEWVRLLRNRVRKGKNKKSLRKRAKTALAKAGLLHAVTMVREKLTRN